MTGSFPHDQRIIVADPDSYDEEHDVFMGFAISRNNLDSFIADLERLVKEYGGIGLDELPEDDPDESPDSQAARQVLNEVEAWR